MRSDEEPLDHPHGLGAHEGPGQLAEAAADPDQIDLRRVGSRRRSVITGSELVSSVTGIPVSRISRTT